MSPFVGEIRIFAGSFAPRGWAFCNGQLLSIAANTALFSLLGTTYGGNGTSNFALPDFRGRIPVGSGQRPGFQNYPLGAQGGQEVIAISSAQMPPHSHDVNCHSTQGNQPAHGTKADPAGNFPATQSTGSGVYYSTGSSQMNSQMTNVSGQGLVHENRQPYQTLNFIIALNGVFPSRT